MKEVTLLMLKPGFGQLTNHVLREVQRDGLQAVKWGETTLTDAQARELYCQDANKPWRERFIAYLTSGTVAVFVVRGHGAFKKTLAVKSRIREKYALDRMRNAVHSPCRKSKRRHDMKFFAKLFGPIP